MLYHIISYIYIYIYISTQTQSHGLEHIPTPPQPSVQQHRHVSEAIGPQRSDLITWPNTPLYTRPYMPKCSHVCAIRADDEVCAG